MKRSGDKMAMRIGIIGGSGLYEMEGLEVIDQLEIETPYGAPSDTLVLARMGGHEVVFLPRHGSKHAIPPHRINYRANIYAMKLAGVSRIISISAVGSLREAIVPGHFVMVDQFVDRTHGRDSTFFDGPVVAHASMANPVCASLSTLLGEACRASEITVHDQGTYLAMQGPQFSSRAESELYCQWGMDVIGMTNMPEAKLAREAEICYATVAMSTDYDCWHVEEENVSVASVLEIMQTNVCNAKKMLSKLLLHTEETFNCRCGCQQALDHAIFTDLKQESDDAIRPIHAIVGRFL
ncbi:MAG: S-methyl-5'-thioadenosine phosphorylase [Mariprofundaceae bacterium]